GFQADLFICHCGRAVPRTRTHAQIARAARNIGPRSHSLVSLDDPISVGANRDCGMARGGARLELARAGPFGRAILASASGHACWRGANRRWALDESATDVSLRSSSRGKASADGGPAVPPFSNGNRSLHIIVTYLCNHRRIHLAWICNLGSS